MFGWIDKKKRGPGYVAEVSGVMGGTLITGNAGLLEGTRIATATGWRPVDKICVGDQVLTFDRGLQTVTDIQRETHEYARHPWQRPVFVPAGALQNQRDLWLMPDQGLLVECDAVQDPMGDPFAVVPAQALDGYRGIALVSTESVFEVTTLAFAEDEAIYVEGGMLAHCPRPRSLLSEDGCEAAPLYDVLDRDAARRLVETMALIEDAGRFACDPEELACLKMRDRSRPGRTARL